MNEDETRKGNQRHDDASSTMNVYACDKYENEESQQRNVIQPVPKVELLYGNHDDRKRHVYTYDRLARVMLFEEVADEICEGAKKDCTTFPPDLCTALKNPT